jgi:dTDP-4-dehydrorhamnose reductase
MAGNPKPRLLITGGSSYLGQHLVPLASRTHEVLYTYFSQNPLVQDSLAGVQGRSLDILDRQATLALVAAWKPASIIHTAGSNRSPNMRSVIEQGASNIRDAAAAVNARLIHLSTDVLFDGNHAPYQEEDPPNPIHDYGRAKAESEKIVAAYPNHIIVRTSLIYGLDKTDHAAAWLIQGLEAGQPITLFTDQLRNPVWVWTLSRALLELVALPYRGILHVTGRQSLSRAEFGVRLLDFHRIQNRSTLRFGLGDPARWPSDVRLDVSRAVALLQTPLWGVDRVLQWAADRSSSGGFPLDIPEDMLHP